MLGQIKTKLTKKTIESLTIMQGPPSKESASELKNQVMTFQMGLEKEN